MCDAFGYDTTPYVVAYHSDPLLDGQVAKQSNHLSTRRGPMPCGRGLLDISKRNHHAQPFLRY